MAISTYAELKTAIAARLGRSDLTAELGDFIALAEADLNAILRCRQMEQRSYATATQFMALPEDFLELRRVHLQGTPTYQVLLAAVEDANLHSSATGQPTHYNLVGNELQLLPAPDTTYTVEIDYWQQVPALSDSNTTNWLLTAHPTLYVMAALVHGMVRIQDEARAAQALQATQALLGTINRADRAARWSGSPLAVRAD
jgi:hypothetical protein